MKVLNLNRLNRIESGEKLRHTESNMNTFNYIWTFLLIVLSNSAYQICAKENPEGMNPLATLTITYFVAAIVSAILYFVINKGQNLFHEYAKVNWAPFLLGLVIVGLETGFIYGYKAGWSVSILQIATSTAVAIIMIFVAIFFYKEAVSWNKIVGVLICLVGLFFINFK